MVGSVLILEDEALLAMSLQLLAEDEGWQVVGPFASAKDALAALNSGATIDAAILDINVQDGKSWGVADELAKRNIPFALQSGIGRNEVEARHAARPVFVKPVDDKQFTVFLASVKAKPGA